MRTEPAGPALLALPGADLAQLVAPFLLDRATLTRRGLTEKSRVAYRQDLISWARTIARTTGRLPDSPSDDDPDPLTVVTTADLTEDRLKAAYRVIRTEHAASTCQRRVGTLKLFVQWLQLEGHLLGDPTLRIEAPDRPRRLPAGWSDGELLRLVEVASTPLPGRRTQRWPTRDRAIVAVLATTGVRAAELCAITDRQLREEHGEALLTVIGKGNKQRNVPVPPEAVEDVRAYQAERAARVGRCRPDEPMFRLSSGAPLTTSALNWLVDRWIVRAGVEKQAGEAAHGFRHTFAKGLVRAGVPMPTVSELLGHESLNTTTIYTRATAADVRDASLLSPAREILRRTRGLRAAADQPGTSGV